MVTLFTDAYAYDQTIPFYILVRISLKFVPKGPNWQWASIGSGNGLAPTRRQAIIWTNAGPVHRRIYMHAALGGDQLNIVKRMMTSYHGDSFGITAPLSMETTDHQ